jgi:isopenicillin N synthase-like dioxygenase
VEWSTGNAIWTINQARHIASAVGDACRRCGYFFLTRHGVSEELTAAAFGETSRFYSLSLGEKSRYNCSAHSQFLGYRGLGAERSRMHAGAEACEQYRIGNFVETPEAQALAKLYHQPFGQSKLLFENMVTLGNRLMATCAIALGLPDTYFDQFTQEPMHRLGLNLYNVGAGHVLGNTVSYAMTAHVDHAVLTILTQDEPGLEVFGVNGEWVDVPLVPRAFFVFLGDYMERWTNGVYRSTLHRVREVRKVRMSLQYKHKPSFRTVVAPLPPFVNDDRPAGYDAFDTGNQYSELLQSLLTGHGEEQRLSAQ